MMKTGRMTMRLLMAPLCCLLMLSGCGNESSSAAGGSKDGADGGKGQGAPAELAPAAEKVLGGRDRGYNAVHVVVALCDNAHQSIAPVPPALGNGQDPGGNLYWGAMYGVKAFLGKSPHWRLAPAGQVAFADGGGDDSAAVLDRALFVSAAPGRKTYVLAEAYDGARMDLALRRFFEAAAGRLVRTAAWGPDGQLTLVRAGGEADMVCFVGHNGLMDISLAAPARLDGRGPGCAVVLACKSAEFFTRPLAEAGCRPLVTTSGLMAPEAYTLDAILQAWLAGLDAPAITAHAAEAYARYQKCPPPAAQALFVAGPK